MKTNNENLLNNAIDYKQNSQRYLSVILPYTTIKDHSEVLIYGIDPAGYQREPEKSHYEKIKNFIINEKEFHLPMSIILAIDEEDLSAIYLKDGEDCFLDFRGGPSQKKLFRIVDGQHRILAMAEAVKEKPELNSFLFNVIILVTKKNKRSVEMEMFYDINSKGKRLKVDLIELARFNFRILEKSIKEKEVNEHVAIQTAFYLNEKIEDSVWKNAIKFGIHDEHVIGIIGVNAFRESISSIVDVFLRINGENRFKHLSGEELVLYTKDAAISIADFINKAWTQSIKKKWEYCFKENQIELDLFYEPRTINYNQKYYLQKTMGSKAINMILGATVNMTQNDKVVGLCEIALTEFDRLIKRSQITSDDWLIGGTFSGYSSESGFKKVSQFIMNTSSTSKSFR